jgi:hydrogenase nickel incorporation protein HypB
MEVRVLRNILDVNDRLAQENESVLKDAGVFSVNIMSSPGSGKTSLISRSIQELKDQYRITVIEGDIQGQVDAEKISKLGTPCVQVNTGGACHLDAHALREAIRQVDLKATDLLFIENVGNLVCPAEFKLGIDRSVMILSLPEGEDKPLKYPLMFHVSQCLLINKIDLRNVCEFNHDRVKEAAAHINPHMEIIPISCVTGEGFDRWTEWLTAQIKQSHGG